MRAEDIHKAEQLICDSEYLGSFLAGLETATDICVSHDNHVGSITLKIADHPRIVAAARAEAERQLADLLAQLKDLGVG